MSEATEAGQPLGLGSSEGLGVMRIAQLRDITVEIGPLYNIGPPTIPMYSFGRPAAILWQAVYDAMREAGRTDAQATEWLQSKAPRWLLDGEHGDRLRALGEEIGRRAAAAGIDA